MTIRPSHIPQPNGHPERSHAQPHRKRRSGRTCGCLFLLLTLLPLGCKKAAEDATQAPEVEVQATHPTEGPITEEIAADATLAPLAQAAISPKITAPVRRFYVQRGSRVRAGQLLATLENADLAAAALDNKGTYTAAQATYQTSVQATVPEDYTKAQLDLSQAQATLALNQSIVAARTKLFTEGAIPGRDLDTAKATLVQAQATYDIAAQHLASVKKVSNQAAIQTARGTLESAKGKYLGAEAQLNYTEIRSPISGIVTDRPLFAGETAAAGSAVVTVMDTSALLAKLHLAQQQAQQLRLGGEATVKVPGIDDPVPAKVSLISPALDPGSTTVEVWLRVENHAGDLKAGTPVRALISGRTVAKALTIPTEALQAAPDGAGKFVMTVTPDGTASKKTVTVGIQTAEAVQILSGLSPGDTVVTTGSYGLDDKTKVKIGTGEKKDDDTPAAKPKGGKDADDK